MIGYTTLGANDMDKLAAFYDELFSVVGAKRTWDWDTFKGWTTGPAVPLFALATPYNGEPATVGNGVMIALAAPSREAVDKFHAKALELGGTCEGEPGLRGGEEMGFYAGYFRDIEGNKLNAFNIQPQK